ncbi:MAG: AI-2E family transporter [bacterium]
MHERYINVHITSGSIVKTLLFLMLCGLLWFLRDIVLVVLTAVVIASAIEPGIRAFVRWGVSRLFSVILMYLLIATVFFGILFFFIPPVLSDAANFLAQLPTALSTLNLSDATHGLVPFGAGSALSSASILQSLSTTLSDTTGGVFTSLSALFGGLVSFVLIVVFSFYFAMQDTGVDDFLRIITPAKNQVYVLHLWKRSQNKIGKWMQGQLALGLIVGVLLFLGLMLAGVPHPLLLAILAAVFELIPVFGQFMAAIPAVALAFASGGVSLALVVLVLFTIVQQLEAHLIYPLVVKRVVGVPPLLVILALLVGYKLMGFLGVLLSVPIAGAIQEYVSDIEKDKERELRELHSA